jgi:hypothetical protein
VCVRACVRAQAPLVSQNDKMTRCTQECTSTTEARSDVTFPSRFASFAAAAAVSMIGAPVWPVCRIMQQAPCLVEVKVCLQNLHKELTVWCVS